MARKRSRPRTHRTELIVTIEEIPEGPRKKTIQLEPGDIEAMSPEQLAVVLHDSTTLPTVVAGAKEGEAHDQGGDWALPESYRTKFRRLIEILGDIPCDQVTRESARLVRAQLKLLPADTSKYRGMTVQQMIAAKPAEHLTPKSLKDYLTMYSSLFAFARVEKKYRDENPFSGLRVPDNVRDKDRRDMCTDEELAKIFSGAVFAGYGSSPYDAPYRYWAPLIALFTGARLAEIAGLYLEDLGIASGVDCIDINLNTAEGSYPTIMGG